jgi:solute carrier family 45 protein 1/2/4
MPSTSTWAGTPSILGSNEPVRMMLLTVSLVGISLAWGLEMTYGTPYLLQLGLTKSKTSLVWIAGPLSGLIMQPVVGALADRSTSRYGRRRPTMLLGAALTGLCFMLLGWTREIVSLFVSDPPTLKSATIILAVLTIYALDFAINAVQACCRSLIVDTLPISQQQAGSAWASRMGATGNIIGYLIGSVDLVSWLPGWMGGETQFKKMTVISTLGLFAAVGTTCYAVTERRLLTPSSDNASKSPFAVLQKLWHRTIHLPPRIQAICWVQFWSWIGWFPFLFYSSTWIGETYYRYEHPPPAPGSTDDHDALGNIGRLGSLALVIFSFVTLAASIVLPTLIRSTSTLMAAPITPLAKLTPHFKFTLNFLPHALSSHLPTQKPSLITAWLLSNLLFGCIFLFAPLIHSVRLATLCIALAGLPWSISCWAPFAEMGIEINKMDGAGMEMEGYAPLSPSLEDADADAEHTQATPLTPTSTPHLHRRTSSLFSSPPSSPTSSPENQTLHLSHPPTPLDCHPSTGELAGVYLGVLNVYTTLPQLVGTAIAWVVFSLLERSKSPTQGSDDDPDHHKWLDLQHGAPNAVSVCLCVGAVAALVGAEAARRLRAMGRG